MFCVLLALQNVNDGRSGFLYRVSQKTCNIFWKSWYINLENDIAILKTYLESWESLLSTCQITCRNYKYFWRYAYFSKHMSRTSSTDFTESKKRTNAYLLAITKHSYSPMLIGLLSCCDNESIKHVNCINFINHISKKSIISVI